jgi:hypothetical protein
VELDSTHAGTASESAAFQTLRTADWFVVGSVGRERGRTQAEAEAIAFREVLSGPEPARHFRELYARGTPAGRLYALCGLFLTIRATFDPLALKARRDRARVTVVSGCLISPDRPRLSSAESRPARDDETRSLSAASIRSIWRTCCAWA